MPFLCPGVLPPPVPGAGGGHHAEGGRQGGEVIQGSHDDVLGVIIRCHHVTLEAAVTSGIGGRCQTDLCNGPVSGLVPEAGGHGGRDTQPGPGSGHMGATWRGGDNC